MKKIIILGMLLRNIFLVSSVLFTLTGCSFFSFSIDDLSNKSKDKDIENLVIRCGEDPELSKKLMDAFYSKGFYSSKMKRMQGIHNDTLNIFYRREMEYHSLFHRLKMYIFQIEGAGSSIEDSMRTYSIDTKDLKELIWRRKETFQNEINKEKPK